VWLKRQEAAAYRERIFVQGFYDLTIAASGKSNVPDAFKKYVDALFPFDHKPQEGKEAEMKAMMERQVAKGALTFKPMDMSFLRRNKAKSVGVDPEFAQKLKDRAGAKKGLT
jgi:hypothetical protein